MRVALGVGILSILFAPVSAALHAEPCGGVDVRLTGAAEGCVAVVAFGKADGRVAAAGFGKAEGGAIAIVGQGCATQNEEGAAIGVENKCGRSLIG